MPRPAKKLLEQPEEPPSKIQRVAVSMKKVESYPTEAREMLVSGLKYASGGSHPWQTKVIDMAGAVLSTGQDNAKTRLAACEDAVLSAQKAFEEQEAQLQAVEAEGKAAAERCTEREQELKAIQAKVSLATKEKDAAKRDIYRVEPKLYKIAASLDELRECQALDACEKSLDEAAVDALESVLATNKAEETLIVTMRSAAPSAPDSRGSFDKVVLEAVSAFMEGKVESLQAEQEKVQASEEYSQMLLLGARAMLEVAEEKRAAAEAAVNEATEAKTESDKKFKEESAMLQRKADAITMEKQECCAAEAEVKDFEDVISTLELIRKGEQAAEAAPETAPVSEALEQKSPLDAPTPMVAMVC
mmetsp:Transcript_42142/g.98834  ORF Transcript_42142/g.98834 Transcript_42142/m.98834 type:complete len:360 (+) Transcript_42142:130-1209(+)